MTEPRPEPIDDDERGRRRRAVLDALQEGAALRARLAPRASQLRRARQLLRQRTMRG